ncbi:MAG: hypothetical protein MJZ09_05750 [Bacteroidales bacterium]|nr:hypothetical protein [Bacteroidales bacterium]
MKRLLALLLMLQVCSLASAQIGFVNGYFIDNSGIKKDVLMKDWDKNNVPKKITYKENADSPEVSRQITDFKEVRIAEKVYVRALVNVNVSPTAIEQLSNDPKPEFEQHEVYLKQMNESGAMLYVLWWENLPQYYFSMDGGKTIVPLEFKSYKLSDDSIKENRAYRNQLYKALDHSKISWDEINDLDYTGKALLAAFDKHNGVVRKKSSKMKVNVGLSAVYGGGNCSMTSDKDFKEFDFGYESMYAIGGDIEFCLPYERGKWSILLSPALAYSSKTAEGTYFASYDVYTNKNEFLALDMGISLRYKMFLKNQSKAYVDVFCTPSHSFSSTSLTTFWQIARPTKPVVLYYGVGAGYFLNKHLYTGVMLCSSQQYYWGKSAKVQYPTFRIKAGFMF